MLLTIFVFIVILGILVFVHEFGHFITAKRMGVAVEEFGFGFPPRIFGLQRLTGQKIKKIAAREEVEIDIEDYQTTEGKEVIKESVSDKIQEIDQIVPVKRWRIIRGGKEPKKINGLEGQTIYSLNWIPIGGFVKIKGEQGESKQDKDSFAHKKIWKRLFILSSGVAMNLILAFILISIGFSLGLPSIVDENTPSYAKIKQVKIQVLEASKDSPAEKAELKMGDIIVSVDNQPINKIKDFQNYTSSKIDTQISLKIKRGNEEIEKSVIPEDLNKNGQGIIGVWLAQTGLVSFPLPQAIWMGLKTTLSVIWQILVAIFEILKNLIISHKVSADIAGPVGIAVITGQVAKMGFIYILQFTALLSINLAIINFIPFPALDGGRVLFLIIEKLRGKAVDQKIESLVHNIGFIILILLVIAVTFKDVSRFGSNIREFFLRIL